MQRARKSKAALLCMLVMAIMLSLTACGESAEVEKMIDAIGEVTAESGDAIDAAQDAYDALEDKDKEKVENVSVLTEAHDAYEVALKQQDYDAAEEAYKAGNYLEAKEIFDSLGDFEDAADRAAEAEKANAYEQAAKLFDDGKFADAQTAFLALGDYEDSADRAAEAEKADYYEQAMALFNDGNYTDAQPLFESAAGYSDAEEMVTGCTYMQAEDYMEQGFLNTAKEIYTTLPSDFSYNGGKTVADRLASLEKYNAFVELCGVWNCATMTGSVTQTRDSTGAWDEWEADSENFDLAITCVLNEDETVTMTAVADFWYFTNYSTLFANLKTTSGSCVFTYTGTEVPATMYSSVDSDYENTGTLKIQNNSFAFDYKIINANAHMYYTYTYETYGTYNTLVTPL